MVDCLSPNVMKFNVLLIVLFLMHIAFQDIFVNLIINLVFYAVLIIIA